MPALSAVPAGASVVPGFPARIKTSCNLYSFNGPLTSGAMSLEQVLEFCAEIGFDAVDPTGYYFKGYPAVPDDALIYRIKHLAFSLGLGISGTGVRNDFAVPDAGKRDADVAHVTRWVDVAAKLGAPVLRVFDGKVMPAGVPKATVLDWIVNGIQRCVTAAEAHGVMIVLQNHNDALKVAADYLEIRTRIPSRWFGLNVDIGSLRTTSDPYAEIAMLAPYAYTWQVKELVYRNDKEERVDLKQIARILKEARYRGYVPIETLGPGDPKEKVRRYLDEFRTALAI
ncbi:sugar phosphate isomerase/epimerase family protein [Luteitalea sp.]|jgi:sugar phosphate isomerase/epimerase|uniref:sugar phosphate isomerase/epimerase family protein n=1 Tax=Luteitalea sp. TaxID=2004800 RepID=UPI0037C5C154